MRRFLGFWLRFESSLKIILDYEDYDVESHILKLRRLIGLLSLFLTSRLRIDGHSVQSGFFSFIYCYTLLISLYLVYSCFGKNQ